MTLKMIQLNMWGGKFFPGIIRFLRQESPDIVTLQEVTAGKENLGSDRKSELIALLSNRLGYQSAVAPAFEAYDHPYSYLGNAVLIRGKISSQKIIWLSKNTDPSWKSARDHTVASRNILDVAAIVKTMPINVLSTHLAWTAQPVETEEKKRQAGITSAYLKTISTPFLLGGDFNMPLESAIVKSINKAAQNFISGSKIRRTTHPNIHKTAKTLPEGLLVDYICASRHFRLIHIDAPIIDISDHLPLVAIIEYRKGNSDA